MLTCTDDERNPLLTLESLFMTCRHPYVLDSFQAWCGQRFVYCSADTQMLKGIFFQLLNPFMTCHPYVFDTHCFQNRPCSCLALRDDILFLSSHCILQSWYESNLKICLAVSMSPFSSLWAVKIMEIYLPT